MVAGVRQRGFFSELQAKRANLFSGLVKFPLQVFRGDLWGSTGGLLLLLLLLRSWVVELVHQILRHLWHRKKEKNQIK